MRHCVYFQILDLCIFPDFGPAMADIRKEQLRKEIQDILKDADLDKTSAKMVE